VSHGPELLAEAWRPRRQVSRSVSHPDAGKTTLTEKLVAVYGGLFQQAGAVKPRASKTQRSPRLDGSSEKQRGILRESPVHRASSSTTPAARSTCLDTAGATRICSEDTYRTLAAAG